MEYGIPTDIKRAATLLTFKKKLKAFFSQNIYADFIYFFIAFQCVLHTYL